MRISPPKLFNLSIVFKLATHEKTTERACCDMCSMVICGRWQIILSLNRSMSITSVAVDIYSGDWNVVLRQMPQTHLIAGVSLGWLWL